jgi:hypothetical protein
VAVIIMTFRTPHNYPKIFVPLFGLWFVWNYIDNRSGRNLAIAALCTVIAFLFRHDYGLYVGLAAIAMLISVHWTDGPRALLRRAGLYACAVGLFLLPFFVFLQLNGGIVTYFDSAAHYIRKHVPRSNRASWNSFTAISWGPPEVTVRWADGLTPDAREALEARYHLGNGVLSEDGTWEYDLADSSLPNVQALLSDSWVEDTGGIDRRTGRVTVPSREDVARAWLTILFLSLPGMAVLVLCLKRLRRRATPRGSGFESSGILSLAVLAVAANLVLLREADGSRLSDSVAAPAVLLAWLTHQLIGGRFARALSSRWRMRRFGLPPGPVHPVRLLRLGLRTLVPACLGLAVLVGAMVNLWIESPFRENLQRSGMLSGPAVMAARGAEVVKALATSPPIDFAAPPGRMGRAALMRYVHACTRPTDRLLVASQRAVNYRFYFYSGRGFAGGHPTFHPRLSPSLEDQQLIVARLQAQSVPLALMDVTQKQSFESDFGLVHQYLMANYVPVRESSFGDAQPDATVFRVLVDRRVAPTGVYEPLSLPCFS